MTLVDPVEVTKATAFCRDAAEHLHDEKTAAVQLTTLRAFRHILHRCCPTSYVKLRLWPFSTGWDAAVIRMTLTSESSTYRKPVRHRLTLPIIRRLAFSSTRSDILSWW